MVERRYLPAVRALPLGEFVAKRISDCSTEIRAEFVAEATRVISGEYAEITTSFAEALVRSDALGTDPFGYFTLAKDVWALLDSDGRACAFEVITRKRGGSMKLGPTLVAASRRRHGLATLLIQGLIDAYARAGVRKVYVTAPVTDSATLSLDLERLNFSIEAVLCDQYGAGHHERVAGKLLSSGGQNASTVPRVVRVPPTTHDARWERVESNTLLVQQEAEEIQSLILEEMTLAYSDIDEGYVQSLLSACRRGPTSSYEEKGKALLLARAGQSVVGVAVCTPKRGGAMKLSPALVRKSFRSGGTWSGLASLARQTASAAGRHRLYALIPVFEWDYVQSLLLEGYRGEAVLREPYRSGVDMLLVATAI